MFNHQSDHQYECPTVNVLFHIASQRLSIQLLVRPYIRVIQPSTTSHSSSKFICSTTSPTTNLSDSTVSNPDPKSSMPSSLLTWNGHIFSRPLVLCNAIFSYVQYFPLRFSSFVSSFLGFLNSLHHSLQIHLQSWLQEIIETENQGSYRIVSYRIVSLSLLPN